MSSVSVCMCLCMCVVVSVGWVSGNGLWLESQRNRILVSVSHVEVIFKYHFDDGCVNANAGQHVF